MSGHSKWSTIKRQKESNDQKRGQVFTKMAKAIAVAVKDGGGGDPETNFKLRLAMDRAREANMPKDNIQRAIDRGLGKGGDGELYTLIYEGYGPAKVAVMVEAVTDNKNRTAAEIKYLFEHNGGVLAQPGAVSFMFEKNGEILLQSLAAKPVDDQILMIMDIAEIKEVEAVEDGIEVVVEAKQLNQAKAELQQQGFKVISAEPVWLATTTIKLEDGKSRQKLLNFLDELDDHEDVQKVFSNAEF